MNIADACYYSLIEQVLEHGDLIETRNHAAYSLIDSDTIIFHKTPLVTLRKTAWRKALREMEWFLSGDPKCPDELLDWWDGQLNKNQCYYYGYGDQLRRYDYCFDQIQHLIEGIKEHPYSRRHVITTWNPREMSLIAQVNGNPRTPTTCIPGYAKVICENRGLIDFDDISIGDSIWDGEEFVPVLNKVYKGYMPVFKHTTNQGEISCTRNHKVVSEQGEVKEIQDCKRINVIKGNDFERLPINWNHVKNGLVLGDGTCSRSKTKATQFILHIGKMDYDYFDTPIKDMVKHYPSKTDNSVYKVSYDYGDLPKTYEREIPQEVFCLTRSEICDFLLGIFSANGSASKTNGSITLTQSSGKLIKQVQLLLNYLGIRSSVRKSEGRFATFKNGTYKSRDRYDLNILSRYNKLFVERIGFIQKYKLDKIKLKQVFLDRNTVLIRDVISEGYQKVYDITVDSCNHTFWCDGFNVSNCHGTIIQYFVRNGKLSARTYQRSADILLGVPHNFIQHWALLMWLASQTSLEVGSLIWNFGDLHLYAEESHLEVARAILASGGTNCKNPKLIYKGTGDFKASDFELEGLVNDPVSTVRPKLL